MHRKYLLRPISHGLDMSIPSMHQNLGYADWPAQNFKIDQKSAQKRWGYVEDRNLGESVEVQAIIYLKLSTGTNYTVYLTNTDAIKRQSGGTWSYITHTYTTGTVWDIGGAVVTGSSTAWATGSNNPEANDYFIVDDDLTSDSEPDANWAKVSSVGNDTTLNLVDSYSGATSSGNYTVRRVYAVPSGERWWWATLNNRLYFGNGADHVQVWTGAGAATDLDVTEATQARYGIEYANRLVIADYDSTRKPYSVKWSKEGDPSDWTDNTAGENDLLQSDNFITGLGKVGSSLIVYSTDSYIIGNRTGEPYAPIEFQEYKRGRGCIAPYSIVEVMGTNVLLGRDDFYIVQGKELISIGENIRSKFFSIINMKDATKTFGYNNLLQHEVRWFATSEDNNRYCFVWNYQNMEWYYYNYSDNMSCGGIGEI